MSRALFSFAYRLALFSLEEEREIFPIRVVLLCWSFFFNFVFTAATAAIFRRPRAVERTQTHNEEAQNKKRNEQIDL